jgi:hypothetical protein
MHGGLLSNQEFPTFAPSQLQRIHTLAVDSLASFRALVQKMFGRSLHLDIQPAIAVLLLLASLFSVTNCSSKPADNTETLPTAMDASPLDKLIRTRQISVRLDRTTLSPADFSLKALQKQWEQHKARMSQNPELDWGFSVHCLDWDHVAAFFETLPNLPAGQLDALDSKTIYLNAADIQLSTASPYSPEDIKANLQLIVPKDAVAGDLLTGLKVVSKVDTAAATAHIQKAQSRIGSLNEAISRDEKALATAVDNQKATLLEQIGRQKRQRFAAAHTWRINAMALTDNFPDNATYQGWQAEAQKAVAQYAVHTDYLSTQN